MDRKIFFVTIFAFLIIGCSENETGLRDNGFTGIIEGVNFDELFALATSEEIDIVQSDWNQRQIKVEGFEQVDSSLILYCNKIATLRIVSHLVDGNRHYGAIIIPTSNDNTKMPLFFYSHGGDEGVNINDLTSMMGTDSQLQELGKKVITVIPSFRSEPLIYGDSIVYKSEGEESPWDSDVDDALSLLKLTQKITPEADSTRIAILGISRGACVGMLMSVREPDIDLVVDYFGPTDFLDKYVQEVTGDVLTGTEWNLPGLDYLTEKIIMPLKNGELSIPAARLELIRRSPVYFLENMAPVQVHHGNGDVVVYVSQAERLHERAQELNLDETQFEIYIYDNSGHDSITILAGLYSVATFLERLFIST